MHSPLKAQWVKARNKIMLNGLQSLLLCKSRVHIGTKGMTTWVCEKHGMEPTNTWIKEVGEPTNNERVLLNKWGHTVEYISDIQSPHVVLNRNHLGFWPILWFHGFSSGIQHFVRGWPKEVNPLAYFGDYIQTQFLMGILALIFVVKHRKLLACIVLWFIPHLLSIPVLPRLIITSFPSAQAPTILTIIIFAVAQKIWGKIHFCYKRTT